MTNISIRREPMLVQYITGLDEDQFDELCGRVEEVFASRPHKRGGPKETLPIYEQVAATLMLLRHNVTEETVAEIFGITQPAISKIIARIEPVLDEVCGFSQLSLEEAIANRQLVVDGTYVPTGNRSQTGKTNYSGKRKCQCLNIQIASDLDGTLLAVSTPVAGSRHDSKALELCGWKTILENADWIADTAYIGTNAITPIKRHAGTPRTETDKQFNHDISSIRAVVERCIAHLKNWKILKTGYRRQLKRLPDIIHLVTRLELYRLGW